MHQQKVWFSDIVALSLGKIASSKYVVVNHYCLLPFCLRVLMRTLASSSSIFKARIASLRRFNSSFCKQENAKSVFAVFDELVGIDSTRTFHPWTVHSLTFFTAVYGNW